MEDIKHMGIGELRKELSERLDRAFHHDEPTVIKNLKKDRAQAAIIPFGWLEELYAYREAAQKAGK